ncbi:FixH family protein [Erythrobacter sp. JK5]|uniref:FixH family protein n=1 Tax=Erythrobacter sp. JK5 TaxID=2829500 RepID=UPI001BA4AFDA|nr:FixH family protein [Erythrobacter sp. JK5]QUL38002.1 FixH family protein [Erythrobacter sp. JK5]
MASKQAKGTFTGKHMLGVMVVGFGIVAVVNFTMASLAVGGFHGIVVENSYVASQKFNTWLAEAEAERALGWQADAERDAAGHVVVRPEGVPTGATVTAELRRPLGEREYADLTFAPLADGTYRSTEAVSAGRWTMRLAIAAGGDSWSAESDLR